jgi:hypothetical protein
MNQRHLNGHYDAGQEQWNGWTVALVGGALGMLVAGMWWFMQQRSASTSPHLQRAELRRLGQAPSRSHIQLFAHPAREAWPR